MSNKPKDPKPDLAVERRRKDKNAVERHAKKARKSQREVID